MSRFCRMAFFFLAVNLSLFCRGPDQAGGSAYASAGRVEDESFAAAMRETPLRLGRPPGKNYLGITITGSGSGDVVASPPEARCSRKAAIPSPDARYSRPDDFCAFGYEPGTEVTLKAQASGVESRFAGWLGHCEPAPPGKKESCRLVMDDDKRVTAVFTRKLGVTLP